jgi:Domain of unknown function (DUF4352)
MRRAIPNRTRTLAALGSAVAITAVALASAGCSASSPQPGQSHPSPASLGATSAPEGTAIAVSDSNGTKLEVTLTQVIDPAGVASQYSQPALGKHFVGVKLRVQNKAATSYENNANNETTIVLTDGKTDDAGYNPIAVCGNFDNGQIKLAAGASATGCVTFQVANGEKVAQVRYGNTVFPGVTAQWHLSS